MRKQVKGSKATSQTLFTSGVMLPRLSHSGPQHLHLYEKRPWFLAGCWRVQWNNGYMEPSRVPGIYGNYCFYWAQYVILVTVPKFIPQINARSNRKICLLTDVIDGRLTHLTKSVSSFYASPPGVHQLFLETRSCIFICVTKVKPVTVAPGTELWSE